MFRRPPALAAALALILALPVASAAGATPIAPASERYADSDTAEVPDFQRHLLPLMGRLGCNTRSCHGSFQGAGGFRLSLFGYDFKADRDALLADGSGRVDAEVPDLSKVLQKPTLMIPHKGGLRMTPDSWQYRMFLRWIEGGAKGVENPVAFERLEVTPTEVVFGQPGESARLKVVAHWADGTAEDVTCLTRFRTNDEAVAEVDDDGQIKATGRGDTHVVAFYDNGVAATQVILPVSDKVGPAYPDVPTPTKVDALVVDKLRKLGLLPSDVGSDAEFLRRASLDVTGTLPTPEEAAAFLADESPTKRARKIDELLARPTYAAWWTNTLCDLTGCSPRNLNGQIQQNQMARHWYEWIYRRVAENRPYDELVAGIVTATSRKPGQSYDDYVAEESSYYRKDDPADYADRETLPYFWARRTVAKPEEKALAVSYTFLGVRLECAQCHKHPFDQWTQDDFNQFTAFFTPVVYNLAPDARKRAKEIQDGLDLKGKNGGEQRREQERLVAEGQVIPWREVFVNARNRGRVPKKQQANGKAGRVATPKLLGAEEVEVEGDPRAALMDWMRRRDNPYFARAFVNRVWAHYFGVGIIDPPDDLNLANPPSNPALLDYLTDGFVAHDFDMKWLHREILNSDAYRRSWRPNETNAHDERNFSKAAIRRLPAEALVDAVVQATAGVDELPALACGIEDRAFGPKEGAGAPRRGGDYAGKVFGRSPRDTNCDCSRSDEPNLLQLIYLQNDQEMLAAIDRKGGWIAEEVARAREGGPTADADALVEQAYLRTLSRRPTDSERATARAHVEAAKDRADGLRDLLWALLNTKEFMTNH